MVLADDHPVVRAGLAALLELAARASRWWRSPPNGRDAVKEVVLHRPDVAILDLQMPELDGFAATREIARLGAGGRRCWC